MMSDNKELAKRCALTWFELTPAMAREWFTEDAVYESRSDKGISVKGPEEIYSLLDLYRNQCDHFEYRLLNIAEDGDVVLLEREEITFLKNGRSVNVPVMSSILIHNGKIAIWRDYWDLAIIMNPLMEGKMGEQTSKAFDSYQEKALKREESVKMIEY
jgi:limonene-1,2-epoxide hydrolase